MDISVIVPVYNSLESLESLFIEVQKVMKKLNKSFEVVFVEDHSSKESWNELLRLKKQHGDSVSLIRLTKNFGQNGATLCGIDQARGNKIITIDDDLQTPPSEIEKLLAIHEDTEADVVYGTYPDENQSFLKNIGTKTIKKIFSGVEGGSRIGSSFRFIDGNIKESLRYHSHDHLFINQVISWYTSDIETVEVVKNERFDGVSGYSYYKLFRIGLRLIFYYTSIPLRFIITIGIIGSIISFSFAGYYLYLRYSLGSELGFTPIIVAIFAATGLILFSVSVLGIYINRLYASRVRKPHYSIKIKV
ncbi:MAG: glycosyltransferase [Flavobacteriales bacterium]|nr:glycosyltransferase [Flavobacteriales bacterium]